MRNMDMKSCEYFPTLTARNRSRKEKIFRASEPRMTGTPRQVISRDFLNASDFNDQAYTSVFFHYVVKWSGPPGDFWTG